MLFWYNRWAGELPFAAQFPILFFIVVDPRTTVEVALMDLGHLAFRRPFGARELAAWDELLQCIALHSPDVDTAADRMCCCLELLGCFSARSYHGAIPSSSAPEALTDVRGISSSGHLAALPTETPSTTSSSTFV
ncbi:putative TdLSC37 protein [Hordeum vulgare]|nr:putative TdLSC37 protein [Hordeum vulgare]